MDPLAAMAGAAGVPLLGAQQPTQVALVHDPINAETLGVMQANIGNGNLLLAAILMLTSPQGVEGGWDFEQALNEVVELGSVLRRTLAAMHEAAMQAAEAAEAAAG